MYSQFHIVCQHDFTSHISRSLSTCAKYDPATNTWSPIAEMEGPRVSMGVTVYEDRIWIAGGITKDPRHPVLKSVICYNTQDNT